MDSPGKKKNDISQRLEIVYWSFCLSIESRSLHNDSKTVRFSLKCVADVQSLVPAQTAPQERQKDPLLS